MGIKIRQDGQWVEVAAGSGGSDPVGTIVVWAGSVSTIPSEYQLCDGGAAATSALQAITGANVPDLRSRFIVGAGTDTQNVWGFDATTGAETFTNGQTSVCVGSTGGSVAHQLTEAEMPEHRHTLSDYKRGGTADTINTTDGNIGEVPEHTGYTGGDDYHENRPPYYALCYIIKHTATSGSANNQGTDAGQGFFENDTTLNSSKTLPANKNVGIFGPYTIGNNVTLTVPTGTTFTVV